MLSSKTRWKAHFLFKDVLSYIFVFCWHVCLYTICVPGAHEARRWCLIPWNVIKDACELLRRCWEQNLSPLKKQQVLSTMEPSFQPQDSFLWLDSFSSFLHPHWTLEISLFTTIKVAVHLVTPLKKYFNALSISSMFTLPCTRPQIFRRSNQNKTANFWSKYFIVALYQRHFKTRYRNIHILCNQMLQIKEKGVLELLSRYAEFESYEEVVWGL